jgi:hypothetical protein
MGGTKGIQLGPASIPAKQGAKAAKDSPQEKYLCNQPLNQGFWTAV